MQVHPKVLINYTEPQMCAAAHKHVYIYNNIHTHITEQEEGRGIK